MKPLYTQRHDALTCPVCGYDKMDASTNLTSGRGPQPGDLTLCCECAALLEFGEGLRLRATDIPSDADAETRHAIEVGQSVIRERRRDR